MKKIGTVTYSYEKLFLFIIIIVSHIDKVKGCLMETKSNERSVGMKIMWINISGVGTLFKWIGKSYIYETNENQ